MNDAIETGLGVMLGGIGIGIGIAIAIGVPMLISLSGNGREHDDAKADTGKITYEKDGWYSIQETRHDKESEVTK